MGGQPGVTAGTVLVVDDEESRLVALSALLRQKGFEVRPMRRGSDVLAALEADAPSIDVVFADLDMPEMSGPELLETLRKSWPDLPVVMMTSDATVRAAVEAMRLGAYDYLTRPFAQPDVVPLVAARAVERRRLLARTRALEMTLDAAERFEGVVSESRAMREVFGVIEAVAPTDATVLLLGESGTGKELAARAIHAHSTRRKGPFLPVSCSALTETLLESELFGHVKGAFSGATANRLGLFEEAKDGTLFLDEIRDITPRVQVSLLRALQEAEVKPLGSSTSRSVSARVIAATSGDLLAATREGTFHADLCHRLNLVTIQLPTLRDRPEDVPLLAHHFLGHYARKFGKAVRRFAPDVVEILQSYRWPGNVRELENAVQRMVVLAAGDEIGVREVPATLRAAVAPTSRASARPVEGPILPFAGTKEAAVARFERQYVETLLLHTGGNLAEAARVAGIDKSNFRRLARRHGIDLDRYRD